MVLICSIKREVKSSIKFFTVFRALSNWIYLFKFLNDFSPFWPVDEFKTSPKALWIVYDEPSSKWISNALSTISLVLL
nr:hypothetical protein [Mycoplasmopsis bovis]